MDRLAVMARPPPKATAPNGPRMRNPTAPHTIPAPTVFRLRSFFIILSNSFPVIVLDGYGGGTVVTVVVVNMVAVGRTGWEYDAPHGGLIGTFEASTKLPTSFLGGILPTGVAIATGELPDA